MSASRDELGQASEEWMLEKTPNLNVKYLMVVFLFLLSQGTILQSSLGANHTL